MNSRLGISRERAARSVVVSLRYRSLTSGLDRHGALALTFTVIRPGCAGQDTGSGTRSLPRGSRRDPGCVKRPSTDRRLVRRATWLRGQVAITVERQPSRRSVLLAARPQSIAQLLRIPGQAIVIVRIQPASATEGGAARRPMSFR